MLLERCCEEPSILHFCYKHTLDLRLPMVQVQANDMTHKRDEHLRVVELIMGMIMGMKFMP